MQRRTKILAWIVIPTLLIAGIAWTVGNLQRGVKAAYYEWGVTCIIASYAEEHDGAPPAGWDDLVGYEYHTKYLPEPRTMDAAARYVSVDFASLLAFTRGRISELPATVVRPKIGIEQHWIDPKATLEQYFREGVLPHGAFNEECAAELRYHAETRD